VFECFLINHKAGFSSTPNIARGMQG
jgi:hypothetical protein